MQKEIYLSEKKTVCFQGVDWEEEKDKSKKRIDKRKERKARKTDRDRLLKEKMTEFKQLKSFLHHVVSPEQDEIGSPILNLSVFDRLMEQVKKDGNLEIPENISKVEMVRMMLKHFETLKDLDKVVTCIKYWMLDSEYNPPNSDSPSRSSVSDLSTSDDSLNSNVELDAQTRNNKQTKKNNELNFFLKFVSWSEEENSSLLMDLFELNAFKIMIKEFEIMIREYRSNISKETTFDTKSNYQKVTLILNNFESFMQKQNFRKTLLNWMDAAVEKGMYTKPRLTSLYSGSSSSSSTASTVSSVGLNPFNNQDQVVSNVPLIREDFALKTMNAIYAAIQKIKNHNSFTDAKHKGCLAKLFCKESKFIVGVTSHENDEATYSESVADSDSIRTVHSADDSYLDALNAAASKALKEKVKEFHATEIEVHILIIEFLIYRDI